MAQKRQQITQEAVDLAKSLGVDPEEVVALAEAKFEEIDTKPKYRLIMSTEASKGEGKTHFSLLTTPDPVALINFDMGEDGVVQKAKDERRMIERKFTLREEAFLEGRKVEDAEYKEEWENIKQAIFACIRTPIVKTLVIDTGTELWENLRLGVHGRLTKVMPHEYGASNQEMLAVIKSCYNRPDLNVIITHKYKKQYIEKGDRGANWNGKFERAGFSTIDHAVQVMLQHYKRRDEAEEEDEKGDLLFGVKMEKCRPNPELEGEEFEGPLCDFRMLARMIYPQSKAEDWA